MGPLVGVFAAATVAGIGATLGYRLASDVILPAFRKGQNEAEKFWASMNEDPASEENSADSGGSDDAPIA